MWETLTYRRQPSTATYSYDSMIRNHLLPGFGEKPLDQITPSDLTSFFKKVRADLSPKTALNLYNLLSRMFDVAEESELIESRPLRKILHRPKNEREEKPTLAPAVIRQIIAEVPPQYQLFFNVLFVFPVRVGEALGTRWLNIDFKERTLAIRGKVWRGDFHDKMKTNATRRKFRIPQTMVPLFEQHLAAASPFNRPGDFVFCRRDGNPYDPDVVREWVLYPAMDRLKIKRTPGAYGFHLFRHSAGSRLHTLTGDLKLVQETLGHARTSTTSDIYVHLDPEVADSATELLARELLGEQTIQSSEAVN